MIMPRAVTMLVVVCFLYGCHNASVLNKASTYDFPTPVDTQTKPVQLQERKTYLFETIGLSVDNKFDGARLNNAMQENDSTLRLDILPENKPINPSPWFAFRLNADRERKIYLHLRYDGFRHRYPPKFSIDFTKWDDVTNPLVYNADSTEVTFEVDLRQGPQWVAAQEIVNSSHVAEWAKQLGSSTDITFKEFGSSKMGKPLVMLDISSGSKNRKPVVVVLSRQHPPEVTGYFAMQSFVERIVGNDELARSFRKKYRVLVFPLLNPDGVDEGHWRHNAGGIDLNRDWAYYHQPETKSVADEVVSLVAASRSDVVMGLDFHSTWYDIYYTNLDTAGVDNPGLKDQWLSYIGNNLPNYRVNERASRLGQPVTKGWFYTQFKAIGITYEIGDDTPRDFIHKKGVVSAEGLMKLLLEKPIE